MQFLVDFMRERKRAYQWLIPTLLRKQQPPTRDDPALADLVRFCRGRGDVFGATDRDTYIQIGRLQVLQRITEHLYLSEEELLRLYMSHRAPTGDEQ